MREALKGDSRFDRLIEALDAGWEIQEPVFVRSAWHVGATDEKNSVYHFVLRKRTEQGPLLLSLPFSVQLMGFLTQQGISISTL